MWLGQQPFTTQDHVFANIGDGTYAHSGMLAIRQARRGRRADHLQDPLQRLRLDDRRPAGRRRHDPGADPRRARRRGRQEDGARGRRSRTAMSASHCLPASAFAIATRWTRCSAISASTRASRSSSTTSPARPSAGGSGSAASGPIPTIRTYIHPEVCEGCGDCGKVSNCMAIEPLETEFGPQAAHQPVELQQGLHLRRGFCPSFVTVRGGRGAQTRKRRAVRPAARSPSRFCRNSASATACSSPGSAARAW